MIARHLVLDGFVAPAPDWFAPCAGWDGWEARYDNDCEWRKRTTRALPGWARAVADRMGELAPRCSEFFGEPLAPDESLYGGGLQVIAPGGWLNTHLDGVLVPNRPDVRRSVQLVCFVHPEWRPDWCGAFCLGADAEVRIEAEPGRLVAFESGGDIAFHGVERVAPGAAERVTLAVSLLGARRPADARRFALFRPTRTLRPFPRS